MAIEVATGTKTDLDGLGAYETQFKEGDRGFLELHLLVIPPGMDSILKAMDFSLKTAGVKLTAPSEVLDGRRVRIYFEKAIPPLVIIAAAIVAAFIALVLTWKLFKQEAQAVATWVIFLVLAILAAIVIIAVKGRVATPTFQIGGKT